MTSTPIAAPINVLFLCTGNSARSILSEALLNELGGQAASGRRFIGWSAGSHPSGTPHPDAIRELSRRGHQTELYRSKSWDEFTQVALGKQVSMDIVVTVCSNAANEVCPVFTGASGGSQIKVHWPAPDPAHIEPEVVRRQAFADTYDLCRACIEALLALSDEALSNQATLQHCVQAIADITA